ncbi:MAG: Bro-N domain-containing protein [Ardenticatenaceae bacterium]|nr:Bro-N domain-containing protein [Ardenticatenaceae bacterium]
MSEEKNSEIDLFEQAIRRTWDPDEEKWYFSVSDVVGVLTDSKDAKAYWRTMKRREPQVAEVAKGYRLIAADGKRRIEDCAHAEGVLRVIQSIPSPKAEPFKRWLAEVGYQRLEEVQNPELAIDRMREEYRLRGYNEEWINQRIQSKIVRDELTDEWSKRKVKAGREYAILTSIISKETFGITPSKHKNIKGLQKENLRDHMTSLELVLTMLGEAATTEFTRQDDAQGFNENKKTASKGGQIAGNARRQIEAETRRSVISSSNFLPKPDDDGEPEVDDDVPF